MSPPESPPAEDANIKIDVRTNDGRWGRIRAAGPALSLLILTIIVYLPALRCGFIWDDDDYVTENETLRTADGLRRIWFERDATPQYYPLVHTMFWLEYQLWQLRPFGYHLSNVLLHALGAILLWRVLLKLGVPGAWLAAAIFAVHPVHVESVAWITERKNTLSGVFYLSAALAYLNFRRLDSNSPNAPRWPFYFLSLILFACALMSKTVTVTLPAAILLVTWWKRGRLDWRDAALVAPMMLLAIPAALTTVSVETHHVGTKYIDWQLSPVDRSLIAGRALWFYAGKLVWPVSLTFIYPRWEIDRADGWQYLFPVSFVGAVGLLWLRRATIGRGPLTAVLFFAGTLAPALGFVNYYPMRFSFVADHFSYLASIGVIALVAATAVTQWPARAAAGSRSSPVAVAILLAVLGVLTKFQCPIYANESTLWSDTIAKNPRAQIAYTNLGVLLTKQGRHAAAVHLLTKAIELKLDEDADAYANRGLCHELLGNFSAAIGDYSMAIKLGYTDINIFHWRGRAHAWFWHLDLSANERRRHVLASIADFDYVLEHQRDDAAIYADRGMSHVLLGDPAAALADCEHAARIDASLPRLLLVRGLAKMLLNQNASSQEDLSQYLRLQPHQRDFVAELVGQLKSEFSQPGNEPPATK